jgi:NitT/TauT family transport system substrate-binding protein
MKRIVEPFARRTLGLAATLVTCLAAASPASAAAPLRVGLMPAMNSAPLIVADHAGYFAREGVVVELELFTSQLNRETALQAARIDGTVSDLINAIQAWSRGFPVKVASASQGVFSLLAAPSAGPSSLAAWKAAGRKVPTGLLENSTVYYVAERALERAGADAGTIELVPVAQVPARLELLLAGRIEAAVLPEPLATLAVRQGARRLADSAADDAASGVLLFREPVLRERAGDVRAFYRAYDRAVEEINLHPEAWRAAVVEVCQFPKAVESGLAFPRFLPAYLPGEADVKDVAAWMIERGLIASAPRWSDIVATGLTPTDARRP